MALTSLTSLNSLTSPFAKVELMRFFFTLELAKVLLKKHKSSRDMKLFAYFFYYFCKC